MLRTEDPHLIMLNCYNFSLAPNNYHSNVDVHILLPCEGKKDAQQCQHIHHVLRVKTNVGGQP